MTPDAYSTMLHALARGAAVDPSEVAAVAAAAGILPASLVRDLLALRRPTAVGHGLGDTAAPVCPRCGSRLVCVGSRRVGPHQIRRLVCRQCRGPAAKAVVPAAGVHKKRRRYDSAPPARKSSARR